MEYAFQKSLSGREIKNIRIRLGMTKKELAEFVNVSPKTVERWEGSTATVSGPITVLLKIISERPQLIEALALPSENEYPMRLKYMHGNDLCTVIDVDEARRRIRIKNFTDDYLCCAFGKNNQPEFSEYEAFLESRCFPRERDKMKLMLKELNLPFYDPMMIIEKTNGRMDEDDFWIDIKKN